MKTVYLFRHGDSEESGFEVDYCRKLTEEGKLQSSVMADYLNKAGLRPDHIMTSGTVRAKSTACIAAKAFGIPGENIEVEDIIYESRKAEDIITLVMNSPSKVSSIMIVGHNPLLSEFIKFVSSSASVINMKKSSVARIDFKTGDWASITPASGKIAFYKMFINGRITDAADEHL
jgi:phosphohistidine phosphatase